MKHLKFPLVALLVAGLLTIAFIGCKKDSLTPSVTSNAQVITSSTAFRLVLDVVENTGHDANCTDPTLYSFTVNSYEWFKNSHKVPNVSDKDRLTITVTNSQGQQIFSYPDPTAPANDTTGIQTISCVPADCYTVTAHFQHAATTTADPVTLDATLTICVGPTSETCTFSQGYWFANNKAHPDGVHTWPNSITIGGQTYTEADGLAIWNTSDAGGIKDAKKAFCQLAAIYLSGADQTEITAPIKTIEDWLTSLGTKLSPSNLPMESDDAIITYGDVRDAANAISDFIQLHHCGGVEDGQ